MRLIYFASSLKDTQKFASKVKNLLLKKKINPIILISGELGSGKTTFIRFLIKAFGLKVKVMSPTFVLWQSFRYKNFILNHLDLYRLDSLKDIIQLLPLKNLKKENQIFLIEWGEKLIKYFEKKKIKYSHLAIIRLKGKKRLFDLHS